MRIPIKFTGPAYKSESNLISPEECINLYLRPVPSIDYGEEKTDYCLIGTPGLELLYDSGVEHGVRGQIQFGLYVYFVIYNKLYRIDVNSVVVELGTILSNIGRIGMATNGLDITFVDGPNGYVLDLSTNVITTITDPQFPGGNNIIFIDGWYLVNKPGTGQIWRSNFNDGLNWDGLAFSTAGEDPDNVVALEVDGKDVWVIGERTSGIWYNSGSGQFNFLPIDSSFIQQGSPSSFAHCVINNAVYWLSQDRKGQGQVFQSISRSPKTIDTQPVAYSLSSCDLSGAYMWAYQQDGHAFVVLTIPSIETTWVYDSTVKEWHQRSSLISGLNKKWRVGSHSFFGGFHIVGDCNSGKLYLMKPDVYDENGEEMVAIRTTSVTRRRMNSITVDQVVLLMETGIGKATGSIQDTDPHLMFSWSKDAGRTFSPEVDVSMGKIGETTVPRVTQLGQGTYWCFRIRISAAVKRVILGAYALAVEDHE